MNLRIWRDEKKWQIACPNSLVNTPFLLMVILFSLTGCLAKNEVEVTLTNPGARTAFSNISVSNVQIVSNQIVITGKNLNFVSNLDIKDGATTTKLQIESKNDTSIVANALSNMTFTAGRVFDFILSNASATTSFQVSFTMPNGSITAAMLSSMAASSGQILKYNGTTWVPTSITGNQIYMGTWNASTNTPNLNLTAPQSGDYYIVTTAGTQGAVTYAVGDWVISNGTTWGKLSYSSSVVGSFNGRTGLVVPATGDYTWAQITKTGSKLEDIADINIAGRADQKVLKWDATNSKWIMGDDNVGGAGGGGTVTSVSGTAPISVVGTTTPVISISQATSLADGYLSSSDWNIFNGKQNSITAGTAAQYYRGDKSWQTLDTSTVPENGNLYFTNALALGVPLTGFSASNAVIDGNDTILQAFGKAQGQITALGTSSNTNYLVKTLAAPDTLASTVTLIGVINATNASSITVANAPIGMTEVTNKSYVDNSWVTGATKTYNTTSAGIGIGTSTPAVTSLLDITSTTKGVLIPRMTSAERDLIATPAEGLQIYNTTTHALNFYYGGWKELGTASGSISGNAATVTTNANLTGPISSVGNATSITSQTGTGTTFVMSESPTITTPTFSGVATGSISGNAATVTTNANLTGPITSVGNATTITDGAVTLAKISATGTPDATNYLKGNNTWASFATDVRAVLLDGLAVVASAAVGAGDSILSAIEKLQAQISAHTTTIAGKADLTNAGQTISALAMSVTAAPGGDFDVTNKLYVDGKANGFTYQAVTSNYTVLNTDGGKLFATTNGPTITLPSVALVPAGFQVVVKQMDTTSAIINTTSAQTIDGATSVTLPSQYSVYSFVSTGGEWIIASRYGLSPALLAVSPSSISGVNATAPSDGACQTITISNSGQIASSSITTTAPSGFTKTGCIDNCNGQALAGGATCAVGVKASGSGSLGAISGNFTTSAVTGGNTTTALSGTLTDICATTSTAGTACAGGAIYLGSLSPGATSGSGTNKYMTTPGGCGEIPAGQKTAGINTPGGDYPNADFTPTCSGTDTLTKYWNDGTSNWAVVAGLTDYTTTTGTGQGAVNIDLNYGSANTTNIAVVTAGGSGGYHAAARYCDKLNYGGYTDWYLPNRRELNLMWDYNTSIPGLITGGSWYWSSTEYTNDGAWVQRFSDGYQDISGKNSSYLVRCVRRF